MPSLILNRPPSHSTVSEPRWPAIVALVAVGGTYAALPPSLSIGPRWLLLAIVTGLTIPNMIAHRRGHDLLNQVLGHVTSGILTLFMLWSLTMLILALPGHKEMPVALLRSGAILWASNVLVFALWYWRLDAGGPVRRDAAPCHTRGAFLFPQMTLQNLPDTSEMAEEARAWSPRFVDYLFLAFNTSTALSPTDSPILSRWAKIMVMLQASISLTIMVILVARGVNIL